MNATKYKINSYIILGGSLFLLILVSANLILSKVGKYYINQTLNKNLESYIGEIEDLRVNVFLGEYTIENLTLFKRDEKTKPLLSIQTLTSTIDLENIFDRKIGLDISLYNSEINLIDKEDHKQNQVGYKEETNKHWSNIFNTIVPLDINHFNAEKININFWHPNSGKQPFNLLFNEMSSRDILAPQNYKNDQSPIQSFGSINHSADFKFNGSINFTEETYPHDLQFKLNQFRLKTLNPLLINYIPIDITKGSFEIYTELKGNIIKAEGDANIFVNDLEIVKLSQDFVSVKHFFIEMIAGVANWFIDLSTTGGYVVQIPYEIKDGAFNVKIEERSIDEIIHDQEDFITTLQQW